MPHRKFPRRIYASDEERRKQPRYLRVSLADRSDPRFFDPAIRGMIYGLRQVAALCPNQNSSMLMLSRTEVEYVTGTRHFQRALERLQKVPEIARLSVRISGESIVIENSNHTETQSLTPQRQQLILVSDMTPKVPESKVLPSLDPELKATLEGTSHLRTLLDFKAVTWWQKLLTLYEPVAELYFFEEIQKADLWLEAHPERRPRSLRGHQQFISNWFRKAEESARRTAAGVAAARRPYGPQAQRR